MSAVVQLPKLWQPTGLGHLACAVQILQQLCGINTVMYFTPVILQMAGFQNKQQALLLSCFPAAVNTVGTIIGMNLLCCMSLHAYHRLVPMQKG